MKGKAQNKRRIGRVILISMGFLLTIVLTFTITLAWFYSSDWASNIVTMAGTVGIDIRDNRGTEVLGHNNSGSGFLTFSITTDKAYPGQAIDAQASVYNNGGTSASYSGNNAYGSPCYIRARFEVYTDIGAGNNIPETDQLLNATQLYNFLHQLIDAQSGIADAGTSATTNYRWIYYRNTDAYMPLSSSGTSSSDTKYFYEGSENASKTNNVSDSGYFYLCYGNSTTAADTKRGNGTYSMQNVLKPVNVGDNAIFLWNSTFIIPWRLTNASADKIIIVGVTFQAVQTFIPAIGSTDSAAIGGTAQNGGLVGTGIICPLADNQLYPSLCTYNNTSVQTVFNSSSFVNITSSITTQYATQMAGHSMYKVTYPGQTPVAVV